jgi:ubiquinone/menaquinone biosynthesis C-methylase UbiE
MLGVEVDMDRAGDDAFAHRLAFLDDSCSDMEAISVPVTWIHGRHDAWMDLERARLMLSRGPTENRKLVVVPTGHQLRSSSEALEVFQLIASEVGRFCLGKDLKAQLPNIGDVEQKRRAERNRLPRRTVDRRSFWKTYLLGRDGSLGSELMTNASAYRRFMQEQAVALELRTGESVVDLGSGTGALLGTLARDWDGRQRPSRVHELDYVPEALVRARQRLGEYGGLSGLTVNFSACDLSGNGSRLSIPCRDSCYDAALASLFISYVDSPSDVLREIWRVVKPGGRLVLSGLRRDADTSKLYMEAVEELSRGEGASVLRTSRPLDLEGAGRTFLNDATRLLDLEEYGVFEFRELSDVLRLVRAAGFSIVKSWNAFGDPPQAYVIAARKNG